MFAAAIVIGPGVMLVVLLLLLAPVVVAGFYFEWFWKPPRK
ncbi:MAG: hypothetical protein WD971_08680 [Pirellulales bacterium]